jgi:hypothetical protein
MSNYKRHQSVVNRLADEHIDNDHWLKQFHKSLQKGAVQPRNVDQSLFEQINTIMNGKSKYPSVEAAVEDMKERSGLTAYLANLSKVSEETEKATTKTAQVAPPDEPPTETVVKPTSPKDNTPIVIKKKPEILTTLENYIRDTKGNLPIPAIIQKIQAIHQVDVSDPKDWEDENLIRLVSRLNLNAKKNNPGVYENYNNLGRRDNIADSDIDAANTDAFHALNPAKF